MQLRSRTTTKREVGNAPKKEKAAVKRRIVEEKQPTKNESNKKSRNVPPAVSEDKNAIESLPLVLENGDGKVENTKFTEAQLKRKVQCLTMDGKNIEVPWCLMMQSQIFAEMWTNLGQEEKVAVKEKNKDAKDEEDSPFIFNLPTITAKCLLRVVNWMRHKHGQPEFELQLGQETGQQIWFQPDGWEVNYGFGCGIMAMDLEDVKELYSAANFLDLKSLYHYCVQECALHVIRQRKLEDVRDILCLCDDMSDGEKAEIRREFDLPDENVLKRVNIKMNQEKRNENPPPYPFMGGMGPNPSFFGPSPPFVGPHPPFFGPNPFMMGPNSHPFMGGPFQRPAINDYRMRRRTFGIRMDIDFNVWQIERKRMTMGLGPMNGAMGPQQQQQQGTSKDEKKTIQRKPIPAELIRPILAKLSLADQRWLLTLNWNAHRFLAPRIKENMANWKQTFDAFIVEQVPNDWYHGQPVAHVRHLRPENRAFDHWTPQRLLGEAALKNEMRNILAFVQNNIDWMEAQMGKNEKINERNRKTLNEERRARKTESARAKDRMDNLIEAEAEFLKQLSNIYNRYAPMNPFSRGLFHLIDQRQRELAELVNSNGRELDKKLAEMEATDKKVELAVNEYWIGRL